MIQLKKEYQINLTNQFPKLDFKIERVLFTTQQFVLHNNKIYVLAVSKEDVTKIKIVEIAKDEISIHFVHDIIKTKEEFPDGVLRNLKMISHSDSLLIFVSENINDEEVPKEIIYFKDFEINNPKIIQYENIIEPKEDKFGKMHATFNTIGQSDCAIFPIILNGYRGFKIGFQIALLEIDFNSLTAKWKTEKQKELIKYKKKEYVFNAIQYKNGKIQYFTIGNSYRYKRYGMDGKIHLGEIENSLRKPKFLVLYKCEYDKKSPKLFGRTALFTTNQHYAIIKPYFVKHDPWGKQEKLFDIDKNELVDVILPRGFGKHSIINGNDTYFLTLGKNSKKENLLTVFRV